MQNQLQDDRTASANSTYRKSAQKELAVLRLIHKKNNVSRIELVELTGFSAGLITGVTQTLIEKGLVTEAPGRPSAAGRKPIALSIRHNAAYVVGVDLGSFYLRVVVTDLLGNLVHNLRTETSLSEGRKKVLDKTFSAVHKAINECGIPREAISGIGMAHSGIIDSTTGIVLSYPRPGQMTEWKNVPLKQMLEQEFAVPCVLEDSVRAIALAERCFGNGRNLDDFVYVDVGMGIGAGIFLNGSLYKGFGGGAGEFGHMTVEENGPLCCCGNNGCLEMMASCAAIIHAARSAIERGVDSKIRDLVEGKLERISIEVIAQAAQENDSLAFRALHEAVSHIGVALADVVNLLNPGVIVFGGPLFRAAPYLLKSLKRVIKQRALERSANQVELRVSNLGSEGGALGAARAMSEKVIDALFREASIATAT
jgi:predicted NBD/HSP70 family sugar kinase